MLNFYNVTKKFKTDFWAKPFVAVDNVSFHIPEGQVVGFLGANGAGKTTSLKMMMGLIALDSGKIEFGKQLGTTQKEIFSHIGFLPERPYFYPYLTGRDFVFYMGQLLQMPDSLIESKMNLWAERLEIGHALTRKVRSYSKGMLQRLGFLTTILHDPKLIVLDEPLSGLDPIGRKVLKDAIVSLHREGKTIFLSSHIVPDVEEICQKIVFFEKGKLVYEGDIDTMLTRNSDLRFEIKYKINGASDIQTLFVPAPEKEKKLNEILNLESEIISVNQSKVSLEEILYKVKSL